ncbi:hypothetical protein V865_004599 [Kwoniella europaea PYCC6329]|uniref:UBX domain-containing protein 1 n=1 Tax=Kwoniella europaea PYCC6329 TaxID=1423913 RepID=A0AAX4KKB0_9TREE
MPGLRPTQQDIDQFGAITQASPEDAVHFLESGTTLEGAIEDFLAAQTASEPLIPHQQDEEDAELALGLPSMSDDNSNDVPGPTGGSRTLGGAAASEPLPAGWGQPERPRFGRIGEGRDEEEEPRGGDDPEELYAGGGRSGLAVQNPDDQRGSGNSLVDNILRMASQNGPRSPPAGGAPKPPSAFRGSGHTLGSDEAPSTEVPATGSAPSASTPVPSIPSVAGVTPSMMDNLLAGMFGRGAGAGGNAPPTSAEDEEDDDDDDDENVQTRRLTFWRNGFSIEDGPLLSYDDPQNQALLQAIESGRAPPSVFGVKFNQRLNVEVAQRRREDYQPPPKKPMKAFGGSGNRLGSPAPEVVTALSSSMPGGLPQGILAGGSGTSTPSASNTSTSAASISQNKFEVDESKPTTSIQLRLGDGTRMVAKVNLTHTVGDLRNYVSAARPDSRSYVLQTTFPSKELSDPSETIEAAKLQNAVVVQRFT